MKRKNRISQLTLELYYKGLATYKERRQVKKALKTDIEVQNRYKAIQESEQEFRKSFSQELRHIELQKIPPAPISKRKKIVVGILIAAVLLCAFIPAFLYLKHSVSNKENAIAEGSTKEIDTTEENYIEDKIEEESLASYEEEKNNLKNDIKTPEKTGTENKKKPETQQNGLANETGKQNTDLQQGGVSVAVIPETDTGIHTRGENGEQQEDITNISIPPGITFIFENMFANKQLSVVVIPGRITSIGKNAFSGNPLVSVTIGANVAVDDEAIPGKFAKAYNSYGKAAGTYTRSDSNSEAWEKK